MYNFKKSSLSLLAFLLVGFGAAFVTDTKTTEKSQLFNTHPVSAKLPSKINDGIFDNSTVLGTDTMTCYITSGSKTSASTNLEIQFSSGNYIEWGDRNESIYLVIDDADWSNDKSSPSASGVENPDFNGYVSQANLASKTFVGDNANATFVIPQQMAYGSFFSITNRRIQAESFNFEGVDMTKFKVTNIVVPESVTHMDAGAFMNVPASVTISCVAESKPLEWNDAWINEGANVVWGYNNEEVLVDSNLILKTGSKTITHTVNESYIIGFINRADHEEGEYYNADFMEGYYPLIVAYDVLDSNGAFVKNEKIELPLIDTNTRNAPYDAVGSVGSFSLSLNVDIYLENNQTIDFDSLAFYNIYLAVRNESTNNKYGPDLSDTAETYTIGAKKRFAYLDALEDIVTCTFDNVSTFADYTIVSMNVDKTMPSYYEKAMADVLEQNKDKIASKEYRIRYILDSFNSSYFRITYRSGNGEERAELDIHSPLPTIELTKNKGNRVAFIVKNSDVGKGFSANSLISFEVLNLSVNMHLWNTKSNTKVGRTSKVLSFGVVEVYPEGQSKRLLDLNSVLLITYLIYIAVYAAIAVALFFIMKNKYKNDEFRRVKPKKYLKTALIGFAGFAIILLAVMGLIYRTTLFRNTLYAFNPADVLVVLAGIVALIVIGYFIKFMVGIIKANKARKEILRLKLNEDVKNDGTN